MLNSTDLVSSETQTTSSLPLWSYDFLERHHLLGHAYHRTQDKIYYPFWKNQLSRNQSLKAELERIGYDLQKEDLKVYLLKGFSLLGEIYEDWGERFVSDVDFLVSYEQFWRLNDLLKMYGYKKKREQKWLGNLHKYTYIKSTPNLEFSIEVHTQLFWHQSLNFSETATLDPKLPGFYRLTPENQLLHLCGHLAFEHGFSQLFALMDVYKFVDTYRKEIHWDLFWEKAQRAGLYKSCFMTLFLCQKLGLSIQTVVYLAPKKKKLSIYLLKQLVSYSYLYNPGKHPIRGWLTKLWIKDSMIDSIRYLIASLQRMRP